MGAIYKVGGKEKEKPPKRALLEIEKRKETRKVVKEGLMRRVKKSEVIRIRGEGRSSSTRCTGKRPLTRGGSTGNTEHGVTIDRKSGTENGELPDKDLDDSSEQRLKSKKSGLEHAEKKSPDLYRGGSV